MIFTSKYKKIKHTPRKFADVANMVVGMSVADAINSLKVCERSAAKELLRFLNSMVSSIEDTGTISVVDLRVSEACVGKSISLKRWRARAKGRGVRVIKKYSSLFLKLEFKEEV